MLRIVFLISLLANVVFFVWSQGYLGAADSGREPQRLAAQIDPDKIRLLTTPEKDKAPTAATEKPAEKLPEPAVLCRRVPGLTTEQADSLLALFKEKLPGVTTASSVAEAPPRIVVAITGLANKEAADTKMTQVKAFGVTTPLTLEEEGHGTYRLVFASFSGRLSAEQLLTNLSKRGLKTPRVVELPAAGKQATLELKGPEPAFAPFSGLLEGQKGAIPAIHAEDCPVPTPGQ